MVFVRPVGPAERAEPRRLVHCEVGRVSERMRVVLLSSRRYPVPGIAAIFERGEVAGRRTVEHNGKIDGCASSILRVVDDGVLVVVLANRQDANSGAIAERLAEAALVV